MWSHSANDFSQIMNAYDKCNIKPAFSYKSPRDIRTLIAMPGIVKKDFEGIGVTHSALDDSLFQVKYVVEYLNQLRRPVNKKEDVCRKNDHPRETAKEWINKIKDKIGLNPINENQEEDILSKLWRESTNGKTAKVEGPPVLLNPSRVVGDESRLECASEATLEWVNKEREKLGLNPIIHRNIINTIKKNSKDFDLDDLECILSFIPSNDRNTWIEVGRTLKTLYPVSGENIWRTWSQESEKFDLNDQIQKWKGLKIKENGINFCLDFIFDLAIEHGWKPKT